MLAEKEIRIILEALEAKYGFGYSKEPEIGQLQAKLSIMLEVASRPHVVIDDTLDDAPDEMMSECTYPDCGCTSWREKCEG